jgi:cytochrome c biogenesis protein CcmG/thiol:disulfide interchange protein DsbE
MFLNRYLFLLSLIMSGMAHGLEKNQPLPPVQLVTWENNTVDIDVTDLKGQVLYIDFWASWCIPCKKSFPFMNELHKTFAEQGLQVLAVNMDENRADAEKFLLRYPAQFSIIQGNSELAKQFAIPGLPAAYLVDKNGIVVAKHMGFNDKSAKKTSAQITYLLAQ